MKRDRAQYIQTLLVSSDVFRYIQSLTNNVSFVRYKEVYAAAAEIIGLTLKNMSETDEV